MSKKISKRKKTDVEDATSASSSSLSTSASTNTSNHQSSSSSESMVIDDGNHDVTPPPSTITKSSKKLKSKGKENSNPQENETKYNSNKSLSFIPSLSIPSWIPSLYASLCIPSPPSPLLSSPLLLSSRITLAESLLLLRICISSLSEKSFSSSHPQSNHFNSNSPMEIKESQEEHFPSLPLPLLPLLASFLHHIKRVIPSQSIIADFTQYILPFLLSLTSSLSYSSTSSSSTPLSPLVSPLRVILKTLLFNSDNINNLSNNIINVIEKVEETHKKVPSINIKDSDHSNIVQSVSSFPPYYTPSYYHFISSLPILFSSYLSSSSSLLSSSSSSSSSSPSISKSDYLVSKSQQTTHQNKNWKVFNTLTATTMKSIAESSNNEMNPNYSELSYRLSSLSSLFSLLDFHHSYRISLDNENIIEKDLINMMNSLVNFQNHWMKSFEIVMERKDYHHPLLSLSAPILSSLCQIYLSITHMNVMIIEDHIHIIVHLLFIIHSFTSYFTQNNHHMKRDLREIDQLINHMDDIFATIITGVCSKSSSFSLLWKGEIQAANITFIHCKNSQNYVKSVSEMRGNLLNSLIKSLPPLTFPSLLKEFIHQFYLLSSNDPTDTSSHGTASIFLASFSFFLSHLVVNEIISVEFQQILQHFAESKEFHAIVEKGVRSVIHGDGENNVDSTGFPLPSLFTLLHCVHDNIRKCKQFTMSTWNFLLEEEETMSKHHAHAYQYLDTYLTTKKKEGIQKLLLAFPNGEIDFIIIKKLELLRNIREDSNIIISEEDNKEGKELSAILLGKFDHLDINNLDYKNINIMDVVRVIPHLSLLCHYHPNSPLLYFLCYILFYHQDTSDNHREFSFYHIKKYLLTVENDKDKYSFYQIENVKKHFHSMIHKRIKEMVKEMDSGKGEKGAKKGKGNTVGIMMTTWMESPSSSTLLPILQSLSSSSSSPSSLPLSLTKQIDSFSSLLISFPISVFSPSYSHDDHSLLLLLHFILFSLLVSAHSNSEWKAVKLMSFISSVCELYSHYTPHGEQKKGGNLSWNALFPSSSPSLSLMFSLLLSPSSSPFASSHFLPSVFSFISSQYLSPSLPFSDRKSLLSQYFVSLTDTLRTILNDKEKEKKYGDNQNGISIFALVMRSLSRKHLYNAREILKSLANDIGKHLESSSSPSPSHLDLFSSLLPLSHSLSSFPPSFLPFLTSTLSFSHSPSTSSYHTLSLLRFFDNYLLFSSQLKVLNVEFTLTENILNSLLSHLTNIISLRSHASHSDEISSLCDSLSIHISTLQHSEFDKTFDWILSTLSSLLSSYHSSIHSLIVLSNFLRLVLIHRPSLSSERKSAIVKSLASFYSTYQMNTKSSYSLSTIDLDMSKMTHFHVINMEILHKILTSSSSSSSTPLSPFTYKLSLHMAQYIVSYIPILWKKQQEGEGSGLPDSSSSSSFLSPSLLSPFSAASLSSSSPSPFSSPIPLLSSLISFSFSSLLSSPSLSISFAPLLFLLITDIGKNVLTINSHHMNSTNKSIISVSLSLLDGFCRILESFLRDTKYNLSNKFKHYAFCLFFDLFSHYAEIPMSLEFRQRFYTGCFHTFALFNEKDIESMGNSFAGEKRDLMKEFYKEFNAWKKKGK